MIRQLKKTTALITAFFVLSGYLSTIGTNPFCISTKAAGIFDGGKGTVSEPYLISTPEQLDAVRNYSSSSFKLVNDVDLSAATSPGGEFYNNGAGWVPIGTENKPYFGTFDGNNHKIVGLHINRPNDDVAGLFGYDTALIENLGVSGSITGGKYTGAIAGRGGMIQNCHSDATVNASNSGAAPVINLGGITGYANQIQSSYFTGSVTANIVFPTSDFSRIGGLLGLAGDTAHGCYNTGDVTVVLGSSGTRAEAGGIGGSSSVTDSYNIGNISSSGPGQSWIGGISGMSSTVSSCYNTGSVTGGYNSGGIAGVNNGIVTNCFNTSANLNGIYCGAISGFATNTIAYCYNLNSATGIYGDTYQSSTINCYSAGGNLDALKQQSTYVGFDFDQTWVMVPGLFPRLREFAYVPVTSVGIPNADFLLMTRETNTISATCQPKNATFKIVTWASDLPGIAQVDTRGRVSGQAPGNATITATAVDGSFSDTCGVTVLQAVTGITLNKSNINLFIGGSDTLTATVSPSNVSNGSVKWVSSDPTVVSVDQDGTIHALANGTVAVTAQALDGSLMVSNQCWVHVETAVGTIMLDKSAVSVELGSTYTLTPTVFPDAAGNKILTWATADSSIATVDQYGTVTPVAPGKTTITCTAQDGAGAAAVCSVTVPGIVMKTLPTQTQYVWGQSLDTSGGQITLFGQGGGVTDIAITSVMVSGYNPGTIGYQMLTVSYQGYTATFWVLVIQKVVTGISLVSAPTKTDYFKDQALDPTGGMITVRYNDGSSRQLPISIDMLIGFDSSTANATEWLTIVYAGYYLNNVYCVYINERAIDGILMEAIPTKTTYLYSDAIDPTGGVISAHYNDGSVQYVVLTHSMITYYYNPDQGEHQTIFVSYGGQSTSFNITVLPQVSVIYQGHVQEIGWQSPVNNGNICGTTGIGFRVEALKISLSNMPAGMHIEYRTHVENIGWQNWVEDGAIAGTSGQSLRVEALQILLTGTDAQYYSVEYQAHVQNVGWQKYVKDGEIAGTTGQGLRIEALCIKIVPKIPSVSYQGHVESIGWQSTVNEGDLCGTSGQGLRIEALKINLENAPAGLHIVYRAHVQNIGWQNWSSDGALAGTTGQGLRVEALQIELQGVDADKYSVVYQAHVQNVGWQNWVSDGETTGTTGQALRIEAIRIMIVARN